MNNEGAAKKFEIQIGFWKNELARDKGDCQYLRTYVLSSEIILVKENYVTILSSSIQA